MEQGRGAWDAGTRGRWDVGPRDVGLGDVGPKDVGHRDVGTWYSKTRGRDKQTTPECSAIYSFQWLREGYYMVECLSAGPGCSKAS